MSLKKALLAATMLAVPLAVPLAVAGTAQAQPVTGLYVGAGAGVNFRESTGDRGLRLKTEDVGAVAVASVGWGFGNGLRTEVEGNYRNNEIETATFRGTRAGSSGYLYSYGVMVNALYDFNVGLPFTPYLGAGVGYIWTEAANIRFRGVNTAPAADSIYRVEDTTGAFGYQAIVGAAFNLGSMVPGLALTTEYRFFGTSGGDIAVNRTAGPPQVNAPASVSVDNFNHSILVGLRYNFGVAPAPVAAAPVAPALARTYLVFFDWNRSDLTDRARQIIAEAATASTSVAATRIEVAGHADRSGSAEYNLGLSRRRADTVAAELVRRGVPRTAIATSFFGETRNLVPTADGVREPQNRRVEIVLR